MEEYLAKVQQTLKEMTGEDGLSAKIVSYIRNCMTLDIGHTIQEDTSLSVATVISQMQGRTSDVRIASAGLMERLVSKWSRENGLEFSADFLQAGGLDILCSSMMSHADDADVQMKGGKLVSTVLCRCVPNTGAVFMQSPRVVNLLFDALRRHNNEVNVQEAIIARMSHLQQLSVRTSRDENGVPLNIFERYVAQAGGIDLLFQAMQRYPENYTVVLNSLCVLQSVGTLHGEASQPLLDYAREHPAWVAIVDNAVATQKRVNPGDIYVWQEVFGLRFALRRR